MFTLITGIFFSVFSLLDKETVHPVSVFRRMSVFFSRVVHGLVRPRVYSLKIGGIDTLYLQPKNRKGKMSYKLGNQLYWERESSFMGPLCTALWFIRYLSFLLSPKIVSITFVPQLIMVKTMIIVHVVTQTSNRVIGEDSQRSPSLWMPSEPPRPTFLREKSRGSRLPSPTSKIL